MEVSRAAVVKAAQVDLPVGVIGVELAIAGSDADGHETVIVGVVSILGVFSGHFSPLIRNNKFAS